MVDREAHLQQLYIGQQHRLASETPEETAARRAWDRCNHMQLETFHFLQPCAHSKMGQFHSRLAALQVRKCIVCFERFPGTTVRGSDANDDVECVRCSLDKHRGLLHLCLPHTPPHWSRRFLRTVPDSSHHWQLLQASHDV